MPSIEKDIEKLKKAFENLARKLLYFESNITERMNATNALIQRLTHEQHELRKLLAGKSVTGVPTDDDTH